MEPSSYRYKIDKDLMGEISNNTWLFRYNRFQFIDDQMFRTFYINKFTRNSLEICHYNGCDNKEIDGIYCVNHRICSICNTYNTSNNLMKCNDCNNAFCVNATSNEIDNFKKHCGSQLSNQCKNCYQMNEHKQLSILINAFCSRKICNDIKQIIFIYSTGHMIQCVNCEQKIKLETLLSLEYNNNPISVTCFYFYYVDSTFINLYQCIRYDMCSFINGRYIRAFCQKCFGKNRIRRCDFCNNYDDYYFVLKHCSDICNRQKYFECMNHDNKIYKCDVCNCRYLDKSQITKCDYCGKDKCIDCCGCQREHQEIHLQYEQWKKDAEFTLNENSMEYEHVKSKGKSKRDYYNIRKMLSNKNVFQRMKVDKEGNVKSRRKSLRQFIQTEKQFYQYKTILSYS